MLTEQNIIFLICPFDNCDGVYLPAFGENDTSLVGINLNRPISRQRFSAVHELCHHLKDRNKQFACFSNPKSDIEKYAEDFASELLMPLGELIKQVSKYEKDGYIDLDGVLNAADYFGVSFLSCLYKIAYDLHKIEGNIDSKKLRNRANQYKPFIKRGEQGKFDDKLYAQIFDAMEKTFNFKPNAHTLLKFKNEYIYYDSRLEGIKIEKKEAAEIVTDLRINLQESLYCRDVNRNIIEVAGLTLAYDYVFSGLKNSINIYEAKKLNGILYSTAPFPEFGGKYRDVNTLVQEQNSKQLNIIVFLVK